jgi:hypothetical protein
MDFEVVVKSGKLKRLLRESVFATEGVFASCTAEHSLLMLKSAVAFMI